MNKPATTPPPPRPLQIGEHVLCTITASSDQPVDATIVALDEAYKAAAAHFLTTHSLEPLNHTRDSTQNQPQLIHHLANSDDEVQHIPHSNVANIDTDDEIQPYQIHQSSTKILFREADSREADSFPKKFQIAPSKPLQKKRRHSMCSNVEALYTTKNNIIPDDTPAPHPITSGRVYVHFTCRDRRLDRWVNAADLQRSSTAHIAAAASDVVANTLVDNATAVDFAATAAIKAPEPKLTRARRRAYEQLNPTSEKEIGSEAVIRMEKVREKKTAVRNVSTVVFGNYSIDAWYFSPFPLKKPAEFLYMCGKCLMYVGTCRKYVEHCTECDWKDVPGLLIYDDDSRNLRVFEVSGFMNPGYCQRLCLLGKLFLDHKTMFFDVPSFLFYVVTLGGELAGFFSKEHPYNRSPHNLACIVTLPPHQKKGIGRFLISLSYELTRREGQTGEPERPLSDLGQVSYRGYWAYAITKYLRSKCDAVDKVPAGTISQATGIRKSDVVETLKSLQLVYMFKGETNAVASSKSLEAAVLKVSGPRLPLISGRLIAMEHSVLRVDLDGPATPRTPGNPGNRKYALRSQEIENAMSPVMTSRYEVSLESELDGSRRGDNRRRIEKFVEKYGRARILARLNRRGGLSSQELDRIAQELHQTPKQCRKNLLRVAREGSEEVDVPDEHVETKLTARRGRPPKIRREETVSGPRSLYGDGLRIGPSLSKNGGINRRRRGVDYHGDVAMRGDQITRKRQGSASPLAAAGGVPFSDRDVVKFVECNSIQNDGRRSQRDLLMRSIRHSHEDGDVVVIDS